MSLVFFFLSLNTLSLIKQECFQLFSSAFVLSKKERSHFLTEFRGREAIRYSGAAPRSTQL